MMSDGLILAFLSATPRDYNKRLSEGGDIGAHPTVSIGALQISVIRIRTSNILQYLGRPLLTVGRGSV